MFSGKRLQLSHSLKSNHLLTWRHQMHLIWSIGKTNWTVALWSKVFFSDKSICCISFGNHGCRVWRKCKEAKNPRCVKSSEVSAVCGMIWGAKSSACLSSLCFIISKVNTAFYQEILEHFMSPSPDKLYGDAISFSSRTFPAPSPSTKTTKQTMMTMIIVIFLCLIDQPTRLT